MSLHKTHLEVQLERPRKRPEPLDERMTLAVSKRFKSRLDQLSKEGVQWSEWVRIILEKEIDGKEIQHPFERDRSRIY